MNPEIFREYDIRGLNEELDDSTVEMIGKAYGEMMKKAKGKTVSVGRDNREHSPRISQALIKGITSMGINVVFVGEVTTPELYYAVHKLGLDGGINVTGSHNPPQYNGFKVLVGKDAIYGEKIQEMRKLVEELKNKKNAEATEKTGMLPANANEKIVLGGVEEKNIDDVYLQDIAGRVKVPRKVKVVVDAGNGMASELGPKLLRMLGCEVVELYCKKIPDYPNHIPDPSQEKNVVELQKQVVKEKAELGIAFDGDVDRIGVVDEKGNLLYGDRLLGIFAKQVLAQKPGAKIIFEVKCSQALEEYILALGGKPIMWKTGHSLIKAKMKEEKAVLGGEMSGHMFFALDWHGFDDALLAAAKIVEIVARSGKKVSNLAAEMPFYASSPEYRIDFPDKEKFGFVEEAKKHFRKKYRVIGIDGARVVFNEGWALVRASNTQPKIIIRFEGTTNEALEKVKREFLSSIKEFSGRTIDLSGAGD